MEKYLGTYSLPLENTAIEVYIVKKSTEQYVMSRNLVEYMAIGIDDFIERSKKVYSAFSFRLEPNDILQVSFKRHMRQKEEDRVELRGFGAFSVRKRKSRVARNPKTSEIVRLDNRLVPYFRAGKELREKVNINE